MTDTRDLFLTKTRLYWSLIKSPQTFLLVLTGLAGFMSSRCPWLNFSTAMAVTGTLFLSISGGTIINMWYDRDIDARMKRTCWRPLPAGKISPREALILGLVLSFTGVIWALTLDYLYGLIICGGLFFNVLIYTIWLKRRTPWSIIWGGIAGGMPVLAGRALGTGEVEWVGIMMSLAILFWIPTHILTFSIRYQDEYKQAGIPTIPTRYGVKVTHRIISVSSMLAALTLALAAVGINLEAGKMRLLAVLSAGLLLLAGASMVKPSDRLNFGLFKYASFYMLFAMILIALVFYY
ncbi:MAG: heme o synthase [Anaerolineales bacterium]